MESQDVETPQKVKSLWSSLCEMSRQSGREGRATPNTKYGGNSKTIKMMHPRTPNASKTSITIMELINGTATSNVVRTPPAKRFHKVINPFEAALAERLHLPLIASPSLFQRPVTPQLSSTQFEWTIDEVSSLKPTHVEPHETQFYNSPDPDFEDKAQSAISSYFKEQQIVPSPVDCPLRTQRIILSEMNGNTPISKPGRRIRDCGSQTELTLPPVLPKELEDALKPYFKPQLAGIGCTFKEKSFSIDTANSSMRRKLFDMHNIVVLENDNKGKGNNFAGSSPCSKIQQTTIAGKLSDSLDKSSFGSLSPISNTDGLSPRSPRCSATKRKTKLQNFISELDEAEQLSPIQAPQHLMRRSIISKSSYRSRINNSEQATLADIIGEEEDKECDKVKAEKFTPDRSSSPLHCLETLEFSTDSFNNKVSRLRVNSSHCNSKQASKLTTEPDLFMHDETQDMTDEDEEDDMQVSQLSSASFNCSSSNSDTPRSKRRSANRKNLSQSFNTNWLNDVDDKSDEIASTEQLLVPKICVDEYIEAPTIGDGVIQMSQNYTLSAEHRTTFYRTDSGFNETNINSTLALTQEELSREAQQLTSATEHDVSMACCSTPSKHIDAY